MHLHIELVELSEQQDKGNNFHLILSSALNTAHTIYIKQTLDKKANKPWSRV